MRVAGLVERDELSIEHQPLGQRLEFRQKLGHVPAAPASYLEAVLGRDECAEPIPFDLIRPAAPAGSSPGRDSIGDGGSGTLRI